MRILLSLPFLICFMSNGQTTVSRDTLTNDYEEIEIGFSVTGDFAITESISIHHFSIIGSDTISLFTGAYDVEEDDPSEFLTFSLDETVGEFSFGIGAFVPNQFYTVLTVTKSVGLPEEFIFN